MGSGKTQHAIQYMNNADEDEKFVYITPFLDEVTRIKEGVTNRKFIEPNNANDEGRKMVSLKSLIVSGADIASTHSLFQTADDELIHLLQGAGYTLILDEVMDCVEPVKDIKRADIKRLIGNKDIEIIGNQVRWIGDPHDDSKYTPIMRLAKAGNLFYYNESFLVWAFPPRVFRALDKIIVMTYLFHAQMQRYYFDLFDFGYEYKAVQKDGEGYKLVEYDVRNEKREELYKLIDVYDGRMNDVGKRINALSTTWINNADVDRLEELQRNIYNFFYNIAKAKKDEVYFSTLKKYQRTIAPKGYKPSRAKTPPINDVVIPVNARATNEHAEKRAIAYIFNRYAHPNIMAFFTDNGVKVDEPLWAVSDLLQWIYRSRIRNGEPIQLYLPSRRMRELLKAWANYEI